jgi:Caspase domain
MSPCANPRDYAIVVGINHYGDNLENLRGARNDATFFRDWLVSETGGGLDPEHVVLILSEHENGNRTPTRDQVEDAMLKHVTRYREDEEREHRLYLYLSGHGITPADGSDEVLLLMANAASHLHGRNIPAQMSANLFWQGAIFEEVILFADCCRSAGGAKARIPFSFAELAEEVIQEGQHEQKPNSKVVGLATQWSYEAREQKLPHPDDRSTLVPRGRFTYALLDGLKRAADEHGNVTARSLEHHVTSLVATLGGVEDGQAPVIRFDGDMVLVSGVSEKTRVLISLRNPTARLEVRDGLNITKIVDAPQTLLEADLVELSLTPGLYLLCIPSGGDVFAAALPVKVTDEVIHVEL